MDDNTPLHGTTSQGQDPNFTAELCQFLTSLAKTSSEEDYSNLSLNMTRLREALLTEVVDTGADSTSSPRRSADTDAPSAEGDHDSSGMSVSTTSSSPCPSSSRSRVDSDSSQCSSSSAQQSHSDSTSSPSTSSPGSDQGNSSKTSTTKDLSLRYYEDYKGRRVCLSLQSGVGYELDEDEVRRVFSQLGPVRTVQLFKRPRKGVDGFVDFASPLSARAALNRNLEVGQCRLFTMMPWTAVTQTPVPHQILLESRYLPNVWEKQMVLRSFFNKFGRVSGVVFLDWVQNSAQRFVISFEDAKPAQDLIGSAVKILSSTVFVKEVTRDTINYDRY